MRFLFFILLLIIGVLLWRRWIGQGTSTIDSPEVKPSSEMVQCRLCGVYLPRDESLVDGEFYYCSDEHRQLDSADK